MPETVLPLFDRLQTTARMMADHGFDGGFEAALILGSGLGAISGGMQVDAEVAYADVPGMTSTTLNFHRGRFIAGTISGKRVIGMDGRFHRYEGFSMDQIVFPVRLMKTLGANTLYLSNIAGGLNPQYRAGDIALIVDHINLMGENPLFGTNDERIGPRYPDMMEPYSVKLIEKAEKVGMEMGLKLPRAVYAAVSGPCFETRAEYRMLRGMGADLVGMSSVPEVIAAVHMGMEVMGLSLISDECFPECLQPLEIPVLLKRAEDGAEKIAEVWGRVLDRIA
jgi:purine-nucleoside phosphorylase